MALLWQRAHGEYWMSAPNRLRFVAFSLAVIAGPRKTMPPGRHFMTSRSEEHTSELQSLMRISYAVFCLKKKTKFHLLRTPSLPSLIHTIIIIDRRIHIANQN